MVGGLKEKRTAHTYSVTRTNRQTDGRTSPIYRPELLQQSGQQLFNARAIPQFTYQVFFMKILWSNTVPGLNMNADLIFHYHKELPKLLRSYHRCSRDEAARLAALIFRVKFSELKANLQNLP